MPDARPVVIPLVEEITWGLTDTPWPSSEPLLNLVCEVLPRVEDATAAVLIEDLALLVVDRSEQIRSMRGVSSGALTLAHSQEVQTARLKRVVIELRQQRQEQAQAQTPREGQRQQQERMQGQ